MSSSAANASGAFAALWRPRVDEALLDLISGLPQGRLREACAYGLLGPGKRLRPLLVLASCEAAGGEPGVAMAAACAVEAVHAFSLVHDDLPCMDDDDERRGRPTVHVVHGEATALLAGDALLALGLGSLAAAGGAWAARASACLAEATWAGLVPGQVLDLEARDTVGPPDLETIHRLKTGRLMEAACLLGGFAADADAARLELLAEYGRELGLAFQLADDLLDDDADPASWVAVHGREATREAGEAALARAVAAAVTLGSSVLEAFAVGAFHRRV